MNLRVRPSYMTRLSLYDKRGETADRKLPMCRICCQMFSSAEDGAGDSDRRIAAFRPCGHVYHYACIMERYQKMEDNCTCVTCYARFEDLPVILYMEWSKSARPIPEEERQEIQTITAPDEQALMLREKIEMLKIKLDSLQQRKMEIMKLLNETSDKTAIAKGRCEGLDEMCEMLSERINVCAENTKKTERVCEELETRIKRDENKAVVGEFCDLLGSQQPESKLTEFLYSKVTSSSDPDDLLGRLSSLYEYYRKKVKEETKSIMQLRSTVHSARKDVEEATQRLAAAQRAKQQRLSAATKATKQSSHTVADRKVVPTKPQNRSNIMDDDDFGTGKRVKPSYNFFNF